MNVEYKQMKWNIKGQNYWKIKKAGVVKKGNRMRSDKTEWGCIEFLEREVEIEWRKNQNDQKKMDGIFTKKAQHKK